MQKENALLMLSEMHSLLAQLFPKMEILFWVDTYDHSRMNKTFNSVVFTVVGAVKYHSRRMGQITYQIIILLT